MTTYYDISFSIRIILLLIICSLSTYFFIEYNQFTVLKTGVFFYYIFLCYLISVIVVRLNYSKTSSNRLFLYQKYRSFFARKFVIYIFYPTLLTFVLALLTDGYKLYFLNKVLAIDVTTKATLTLEDEYPNGKYCNKSQSKSYIEVYLSGLENSKKLCVPHSFYASLRQNSIVEVKGKATQISFYIQQINNTPLQ